MTIAAFLVGVSLGFIFGMLLTCMFVAGKRADAHLSFDEMKEISNEAAREAGLLRGD